MSWDPMHFVFRYESDLSGSGGRAAKNRRSQGSIKLRGIMKRFSKPMADPSKWIVFDGDNHRATSKREELMLRRIADGLMALNTAKGVMGRQAEDVAFASRLHFLECLAAFVALNWDECKRASPSSKSAGGALTIAEVLATYAAPGRVDWLFNLSSYLSSLSPQERSLLPCGTTSNEALHAEMRNTARSCTKRHAANLELAMSCFSIGKLLAHQQSLLRPTLRGTRQGVVMAR